MNQTTNEVPKSRYGNFSSSNIWKLCTNNRKGEPFGTEGLKYIKQCNYERALGRSITNEMNARQTSYGKIAERVAFDLLPSDYKHVGDEKRYVHPEFNYWLGVPDLFKPQGSCNSEVKSPFNLEKFCDKLPSIEKGWEQFKEDYPEDAWQLVSNNILLNANGIKCDTCEAINFVPYLEDMSMIANKLVELGLEDNHEYRWMKYADFEEMPYLIKGMQYKNLNIAEFTIPQSDKDFLTERVKLAGTYLK